MRRTSLTRLLAGMVALVALAGVLVTGLAMLGLYRQGATESARSALGRDADTVAAAVEGIQQRRLVAQQTRTARLTRQLETRSIVLALVLDGEVPAAGLPAPLTSDDVTSTQDAGTFSTGRDSGDRAWLVEGRSVEGALVLLAQPVDRAVAEAAPPRRRLVLPLLLGLAGGGLAGALLARQVAAPLARLASAARRLSEGQRDVRVPTDGPIEIADVGQALNGLAAALAGSEARQRRFLLDVSHELRTPLTAVAGYAEGLAEGTISGREVPHAGAVIRDEAARLGRRVDDLLSLARMEADDFRLQLAAADLGDLLAAAARAWHPRAAASGIRLELDIPPSRVVVTTDAERLRQAIDALSDNAVRVLPAGSLLVLACGAAPDRAWVQVRDDGPGLAEEDLAVAFERGLLTERYRGDRPVGSGVGLALVGELARRLGGRAMAGRAPEGGVAFTIELPLG